MAKILAFIISFLIFLGLGIWGDCALINLLTALVPSGEWQGFINVIITIVIIACTAGTIFYLSLIMSLLVAGLMSGSCDDWETK